MSKDGSVKSWPCSYFLTNEKRWISGRLSLTPKHLRFTADNTNDSLVSFHLSSINEIKKESSSFIFSSITVLEGDNVKHWFSSLLPNRNVVFTVLEHFWREQLLSPQGPEAVPSKTSKGKELIKVVSGSEKRMEETAKVLHHQGEQFGNIMRGINKIEGDMSTTDRMLSILESPSWWPFSGKPWRSSSCDQPKECSSSTSSQNQGKEGVIVMIPIIFSQTSDSNFKPGKLSVLLSALEILDLNSHLVHRYERGDIDDIKVITGYDISVRQRFIGKPDITYRILSARLPEVIPILEMQYIKKIEFHEEALLFSEARRTSPADKTSPIYETESWLLDSIVRTGPLPNSSSQTMIQDQAVSESEAQELRKILMKLKGLALEAENELERQDEELDQITSSTDRAIMSIDKQNRRMRNLL
ncbi:synaptosomal-associated protein 47 [Bombina bombina]|uniref:synaptosomal-associated protein 47 n=1 Tax=Bombina bombina TaxID=8345 RepID=UPI00235AF9C4|nr:synaptosomal-associated protein 47 [Bombina bombina]